MSSQVEVWETHPLIYHYTASAGLNGILSTNTLRATHYMFLNDHLETKILTERIWRHFTPHFKKAVTAAGQHNPQVTKHIEGVGGIQKAAEAAAKDFCRALYSVAYDAPKDKNLHEPFIISFCGHSGIYEKQNGLLSQWRAYGHADGYAIAFDTEKLWKALERENEKHAYSSVCLDRVVYDEDDEGFEAAFHQLIEKIPDVIRKTFFQDMRDNTVTVEALFQPFAISSARYKHRGFFEESEVRAILSPMPLPTLSSYSPTELETSGLNKKHIKQVFSQSTLRPFIEIRDLDLTALIKYIIVGPNQNKQDRANRLSKFLRIHDIEIEIKVSDTPLV